MLNRREALKLALSTGMTAYLPIPSLSSSRGYARKKNDCLSVITIEDLEHLVYETGAMIGWYIVTDRALHLDSKSGVLHICENEIRFIGEE